MKKMSLITIGVTGALILATAATALAAPSVRKEQTENDTRAILSSSTAKSAPTELPEGLRSTGTPEKMQNADLPEGVTLPDEKEDSSAALPEKPEGDEQERIMENPGSMSHYVPKLRPETKPEGEDMVPPEFEGIEGIDQLGRPAFRGEGMPEKFDGMPGEFGESGEFGGMPGEFDESGEFGGMPGGSAGRPGFHGESAPDGQFGHEIPEDMPEEFGGIPGEFDKSGEFGGMPGESTGRPDFHGESAPDMQTGNETAL